MRRDSQSTIHLIINLDSWLLFSTLLEIKNQGLWPKNRLSTYFWAVLLAIYFFKICIPHCEMYTLTWQKNFFRSSQGLAKLLSQVLLRGICERNYEKPLHVLLSSPIISSTSSLRSTTKTESKAATINVISSKNAMFPLKPHLYSGDRWINPFYLCCNTYLGFFLLPYISQHF